MVFGLQEVRPGPSEQTSPTGGGLRTIQIKLGSGWYRVYSVNITTNQGYQESAKVYMEYEHSDESTSDLHLGAGVVSKARPFVINDVMVEGPGKLTGEVFLLEAATTFSFVVNYRKGI